MQHGTQIQESISPQLHGPRIVSLISPVLRTLAKDMARLATPQTDEGVLAGLCGTAGCSQCHSPDQFKNAFLTTGTSRLL